MRGDLANGYGYAQLNPLNANFQWIDILNVIRESRNWDIYNIQSTVKYQLYVPQPGQRVTEYVQQFRNLASSTTSFKNQFYDVKATLLGHLSKYFQSDIIRHNLTTINNAQTFFTTVNLIFIGVHFPATSSSDNSVAQIETNTDENMDVNYLNKFSKKPSNYRYNNNSNFKEKQQYQGNFTSNGYKSNSNNYNKSNKDYQGYKRDNNSRRFKKIYEVILSENESDTSDIDANLSELSSPAENNNDVNEIAELDIDDFDFIAKHRLCIYFRYGSFKS